MQILVTATSAGPAAHPGGAHRALAVTGAKRAEILPEVPTIAESGLPGYEVDGWYGLLFPAKPRSPGPEDLQRRGGSHAHTGDGADPEGGFDVGGMPPVEYGDTSIARSGNGKPSSGGWNQR